MQVSSVDGFQRTIMLSGWDPVRIVGKQQRHYLDWEFLDQQTEDAREEASFVC